MAALIGAVMLGNLSGSLSALKRQQHLIVERRRQAEDYQRRQAIETNLGKEGSDALTAS